MLTAFDGGKLYGELYGTGTPWVLALHGWRRDHRDFDAVLNGPPEGARPGGDALAALAVDLPGFGATPPPPRAWGSEDYAEALLPVLDEMSDPVVVLGHSFGGRVAIRLAGIAGERVHALVLTGVPLFRPLDGAPRAARSYRLLKRLARAGLVSEERLEGARRRHGSADYQAANGVMRDVLVRLVAEDYRPALSGIGCPVELVWGDDDASAPIGLAEAARADIAESRLTVCPGAGHLTPITVPEALRAALARCRP